MDVVEEIKTRFMVNLEVVQVFFCREMSNKYELEWFNGDGFNKWMKCLDLVMVLVSNETMEKL
jgi:hypothetical protein